MLGQQCDSRYFELYFSALNNEADFFQLGNHF